MKTSRLINFLRNVFSGLYYLTIGATLALLVVPTLLHWGQSEKEEGNARFTIDIPYRGILQADDHFSPGKSRLQISDHPSADLTVPNQQNEYNVEFQVSSFQEFLQLPRFVQAFVVFFFLLTVGGFLRVTYLLRRLFEDFSEGEVFSVIQIKRIKTLGWTLVGLFLLSSVFTNVNHYYLTRYLEEHNYEVFMPIGIPFVFPDNWLLPLTGLILLALSHIFLYGLTLQRETELTI
ncbi:DUF2975 domain-containing protein [Tellurirhabdus bombi]|uniref:DUF2975 domain-containing protein n=1 Tax=Tellurirhabdus bombi TaxID=2907205 RepID=UPI001F1A246A|nr:DUF2975 domain-containing protein [Tellurirhabdus bombi]